MSNKKPLIPTDPDTLEIALPETTVLVADLRQLISQARERVAIYVNQELTLLHWDIGQRIQVELLKKSEPNTANKLVRQCRTN